MLVRTVRKVRVILLLLAILSGSLAILGPAAAQQLPRANSQGHQSPVVVPEGAHKVVKTQPAPGPVSQAAKPPAPDLAQSEKKERTQVKVGLYVTQLYDLDMAKRSFTATFWAWYLSPDDKYKPFDNVEVVNAKAFTSKFPVATPTDDAPWLGGKRNLVWSQGKYNAVIAQDWDIGKFPFDHQLLSIVLEDVQNDASEVEFIPDTANSKIGSSVIVPGWTVGSLKLHKVDMVYDTTYGDPKLTGDSTYSRIVAEIEIQRKGLSLISSMFIGYLVAFFLIMFTYFMDIGEMAGTRFGLAAASVFASIGNKYTIDNVLPPSPSFTLADCFEATTFGVIVFTIMMAVILGFLNKKHPHTVYYTNYIAFSLCAALYIGMNGWFILWAMR
jgi:hypothetical protein